MRRLIPLAVSFTLALAAAAALSGLVSPASAQIPITSFGVAVTENFNSIGFTPDNTLFTALPTGWALSETGTGANTTYRSGSGTNTAGDTYSFGATGNSERAFGALQSGTVVPTIGAQFVNNASSQIGRLIIEYTGEQWRLGATGRLDKLDFQYSLDATSLTTGLWFDFDPLDFTAPVQAGTVGALDGNAAGNRTLISSTITGLAIPPNATFWIRWLDFNAAGSDDGLGVDDFSLTALEPPVPAPPTTLGELKAIYR
jgi:hypothetical protein